MLAKFPHSKTYRFDWRNGFQYALLWGGCDYRFDWCYAVKLAMQSLGGTNVGIVSLLFGWEAPEIYGFPVFVDAAPPQSFGLVKAGAPRVREPMAAIVLVLETSCVSQIAEPIVETIPVDMINLSNGPCTSHIKPCEPMREIELAVNADHSDSSSALPIVNRGGSRLSVHASSRTAHQPPELTGI
jgi:hypothetical protein